MENINEKEVKEVQSTSGPVTFDDVAGKSVANVTGILKPTLANNVNVETDDLAKWAAMPVKVATIAFSTADTVGTKYPILSLNDYLTAATGFVSRLRNVGTYRFKSLKVRFVTAVSPFANGILAVSAWPRVSEHNLCFSDSRYKLFQGMVGDLRIPVEEDLEIDLDFVSPYTAFDRNGYQISGEATYNMWQITPWVLAKLNAGAAMTQEVSVYMSLEGFEVCGTSMESGLADNMPCEDVKEVVRRVRKPLFDIGSRVYPSPMWGLVSGMADMAGFNTPPVSKGVLSVAPTWTAGGDRNMHHLTNLIEEPGEQDNYDPLSFAAIATVPYLQYDTDIAIGTGASVLANVPLTPYLSGKTSSATVLTNQSPMNFCAAWGSKWRTGFRVNVTIAHSKQTGRFRVTYVPYRQVSATPTESDKSTLPSVTFSLGEIGPDGKAIFSRGFDIPYASLLTYLQGADTKDSGADTIRMGFLHVELVSDLVGPSTCGDITVLISVSADENFCVSGNGIMTNVMGPCMTQAQQTTPEVGLSYNTMNEWSAPPEVPSWDGRAHPFHNVSNVYMFGKRDGMENTVDSAVNSGYPITSFRQLVGKMLPVASFGAGATRVGNGINFHLCEFWNEDTLDTTETATTLIAWLRSMFCFETGTLMVGTPPRVDCTLMQIQLKDGNLGTNPLVISSTTDTDTMTKLNEFETFPSAPGMVASVPRYSLGSYTPLTPGTRDGTVVFPNAAAARAIPQTTTWLFSRNGTETVANTLYLGAREDYRLLYRRPIPSFCSSAAFI